MDTEALFHLAFVVVFLSTIAARAIGWKYVLTAEHEHLARRAAEGLPIFATRVTLGYIGVLLVLAYTLHPALTAPLTFAIPSTLRWAGFLIGMAGAALLAWVHKHLAENFTDSVLIRIHHRLVTSGPYQFIRHPMYLAFILLIAGLSLLAANWLLAVTGIALMFHIMFFRTPIEEARLHERHGKIYEMYRKRTGGLLPKLWGRQ